MDIIKWTVVRSNAHERCVFIAHLKIQWWIGGGYGKKEISTVLLHNN